VKQKSFGYLRRLFPHMPIFMAKGSKPNKYTPHQGKQECARRLRQARGIYGKQQDENC